MTSLLLERIRGIAADILEVPAASITTESSPESVASWDSVRHLNLVLALEEEFGLQLDPEEIDRMHSIGEIVAALEGKVPQR